MQVFHNRHSSSATHFTIQLTSENWHSFLIRAQMHCPNSRPPFIPQQRATNEIYQVGYRLKEQRTFSAGRTAADGRWHQSSSCESNRRPMVTWLLEANYLDHSNRSS